MRQRRTKARASRAGLRQIVVTGLLVAGGVLVIGLAAWAGAHLDPQSFEVNLLAGVVDVVAGIALTLLIVNRYLAFQRRKQWARTSAFTARAIAVHLGEITGTLFFHYELPFGVAEPFFASHSTAFNPTIVKAFDRMLQALRDSPSAALAGISPSDAAVVYYDALKWDFAELSSVLTPRVLESPAEQGFIDRLVEFDEARRELRHAIIAHQQAVTQSVFPNIVRLIERAQRLYMDLLSQYGEQEPGDR